MTPKRSEYNTKHFCAYVSNMTMGMNDFFSALGNCMNLLNLLPKFCKFYLISSRAERILVLAGATIYSKDLVNFQHKKAFRIYPTVIFKKIHLILNLHYLRF